MSEELGLTFGEITQAYQDETGDKVTDVRTLAHWLYQALTEISLVYGKVKEFTIVANKKGERYALPSDHVKTIDIEKDGKPYLDFIVDAHGFISFDTPGEFLIRYHSVVPKVDHRDLEAKPECHVLFHAWLSDYLAGKYWATSSEGIAGEVRMAAAYFQTFHENVAKTAETLRRREYRPRRSRIPN